LVSQSLFADGCIKYTVNQQTDLPHFSSSQIHEEILPHSQESMTWKAGSDGFEMFLAKEIPVHIKRGLQDYLERLCLKTKTPLSALKNAIYAVHPGGPKILKYIQELLGLEDHQMAHSRQIFESCGNMSSATLPHIWEIILNDEKVSSQTNVVNLAFGPGLTIAGSIMVKE
jgi:predicted naringenin-chalcone synthase